jgi:FAD/FMN-containing dehydrogenase
MPQSDDRGLQGAGLTGSTSRRRFLGGAGAVALGAWAVVLPARGGLADAPAAPRGVSAGGDPAGGFGGVRVGPSDPRYHTLSMGFNQRWVGTPAYIQVVAGTAQVVETVREAVRAGLRVTVRGGGHCYEDFVSGNRGGVIIDMSQMHGVSRSADGTLWLEGGCTNWDVYTELYKRYDVTLPGGSCYSVGLGGHVAGGGYGLLSRQFGLTVDYLSAVEMVVVSRDRSVSVVTARRGDSRTGDLLWANTGGGGGNFGVITRYGFQRLPRPPQEVWLSVVAWDWGSITAGRFRTLLRNYGRFMAANSQPGSRYAGLFSLLKLTHRSAGQIVLVTQVLGADEALLGSFLAQISRGVGIPVAQTRAVGAEQAVLGSAANRLMPWLQATQTLNGSGANQRGKYKSAYMITPFPARQVTAIHAALTDPSYDNPQALLQVDSYGCQVNARQPSATAVAQRSSIMKLQYQTYWTDPADDNVNLAWIRRFYQAVYAASGGTPVSNGITDGCYVNYPDVDLKDYSTLYYKQNYPRLQRVKARWDPTNAFRYSQSIHLP